MQSSVDYLSSSVGNDGKLICFGQFSFKAWNEQHRVGAPKKRPELINQLKKNHRRTKLPNTVTIDSIYEKNFLSLGSVLEVVIVDTFVLPGTGCFSSSIKI